MNPATTSRRRSPYLNGADLQVGRFYRLISGGDGAIYDSETFLLATDQTDKRGNRLVVNTADGSTVYASATSVWSTEG